MSKKSLWGSNNNMGVVIMKTLCYTTFTWAYQVVDYVNKN